MTVPVLVQIVGAPVACADGVKDTWRELATWAAEQLRHSCGSGVKVKYFDLFDPAGPALPAGAQLPLVIINDEVFSQGGKLNVPAIRRKVETLASQG